MAEKAARSERLTLTLTPGQFAYLKKLAMARKLPLAGLGYRLLVDALRREANGS